MRSIYELSTEEAYQIVSEHFGHPLPPLEARIRAGLIRGASSGNDIQLTKRQSHKEQHDAHEHRPIGFERRQLADPGTTDSQGQQHQRRDAAKRADDRCQHAGPQLLSCGLHGGVAYTTASDARTSPGKQDRRPTKS